MAKKEPSQPDSAFSHLTSLAEQEGHNLHVNYATFTQRLFATVIDTFLSLIVLFPIFNVIRQWLFSGRDPAIIIARIYEDQIVTADEQQQLAELVTPWVSNLTIQAVIFTSVILLFWIYRSATPGKIIFSLKIINAADGGTPTFKQWIWRSLSYTISTLPLCLGFFWMLFDKRNQCWHDKIAHTLVVKVKRGETISRNT